MDLETSQAIALCAQAHQRLLQQISGLTDEQVRQPSRLPDWTVGHVLTHLARNAEGHALRLEGALLGEEVARYPGGGVQRDKDSEEGAGRSAAALIEDVALTNARIEEVWQRSEEAGWPNTQLFGADRWPITASPSRRLREVEIHHVDLGLGYEASSWSDEYAAWELSMCLKDLPSRLDGAQTRKVVLWLTGRTSPAGIDLASWG
jgi:maleylpyruvate isomerase